MQVVVRKSANLPVKIREFLRQFQVVIAMIMMMTTLRFVVFKIGHKALYGVLKRPQSALWCFKWEKPNYFRK